MSLEHESLRSEAAQKMVDRAIWTTSWCPAVARETEVAIIDDFLDTPQVATVLKQLDDPAFQSQFASYDQYNPDSGRRRFCTVLLDGTIEEALHARMGCIRDLRTKPPVQLPAVRTQGSVQRHCDRHGFVAGRPHTKGPTAVIYLTDGGDLVFDDQRVSS